MSPELNKILSNHVSGTQKAKKNQPVLKNKSNDFENILKNHFKKEEDNLKISKHAYKRLEERDINLDSNEFLKLKNAAEKLKAKGSRESLIITDKAAYILDVNKNTLITAMGKDSMNENIVTNIDSTIFI